MRSAKAPSPRNPLPTGWFIGVPHWISWLAVESARIPIKLVGTPPSTWSIQWSLSAPDKVHVFQLQPARVLAYWQGVSICCSVRLANHLPKISCWFQSKLRFAGKSIDVVKFLVGFTCNVLSKHFSQKDCITTKQLHWEKAASSHLGTRCQHEQPRSRSPGGHLDQTQNLTRKQIQKMPYGSLRPKFVWKWDIPCKPL